jgi:hypothetical protein
MRSAIDMQVENAVDKFFSRYKNTLDLLQELLVSRRNRQEFVLLSCARLDALANLAFAEGNQKSRFSRFLARYSGLGEQTFAISVPDLNYYFQHYSGFRLRMYRSPDGRPHLERREMWRTRSRPRWSPESTGILRWQALALRRPALPQDDGGLRGVCMAEFRYSHLEKRRM